MTTTVQHWTVTDVDGKTITISIESDAPINRTLPLILGFLPQTKLIGDPMDPRMQALEKTLDLLKKLVDSAILIMAAVKPDSNADAEAILVQVQGFASDLAATTKQLEDAVAAHG